MIQYSCFMIIMRFFIKKLSVIWSGFVIRLFLLFYINCILVTRIPGDGQRGVRNLLLIVHICKCAVVGLSLSKQHLSLSQQRWRRLSSSKGMGPCWLVHSNCHSGGALFIWPGKNPEHGGNSTSSQHIIISKMTLIFINTRFYTKKWKK